MKRMLTRFSVCILLINTFLPLISVDATTDISKENSLNQTTITSGSKSFTTDENSSEEQLTGQEETESLEDETKNNVETNQAELDEQSSLDKTYQEITQADSQVSNTKLADSSINIKKVLTNSNMSITDGLMNGWLLSKTGTSTINPGISKDNTWGVNLNQSFSSFKQTSSIGTTVWSLTKLTLANKTNQKELYSVQTFEGKAGTTYSFRGYFDPENGLPSGTNQLQRNWYTARAYIGPKLVGKNQMKEMELNSTNGHYLSTEYTCLTDGPVYFIIGGEIKFNFVDNAHKDKDVIKLRPYADEDNIPPTITASDQCLNVNDNYDPYANVYAEDEEDGRFPNESILYEITDLETNSIVSKIDTSKPGQYEVKYTVMDSAGATASAVSKVNVNDPPKIFAEDIELHVGDQYDILKNVTATDYEDGDLTQKIKYEVFDSNNLPATVDTTKPGNYKVVYKVSDSMCGTTTKTIKVIIKDIEKKIEMDINDVSSTTGDKNVPFIVNITSSTKNTNLTNATVSILYPKDNLSLGKMKITQNGKDITSGTTVDKNADGIGLVQIKGINAKDVQKSSVIIQFDGTEALREMKKTNFGGEIKSEDLYADNYYDVEIKKGNLKLLWVPDVFDFKGHNLEEITAGNKNEFESISIPAYAVVSDTRGQNINNSWRVSVTTSSMNKVNSDNKITDLSYLLGGNELQEYSSNDDSIPPNEENVTPPPSSWENFITVKSNATIKNELGFTNDIISAKKGVANGKYAIKVNQSKLKINDLKKVTEGDYEGSINWMLIDGL